MAASSLLVLIDDIATTCSTLSACARQLLAAGAISVTGLTLAREDWRILRALSAVLNVTLPFDTLEALSKLSREKYGFAGAVRDTRKTDRHTLLGVYRDHNAHHAIVVKIGKTRISFVEMKKGQLTTQSLPDTKFFGLRGFERIEYPLERAVENFLKHGGGVSDWASALTGVTATSANSTGTQSFTRNPPGRTEARSP